MGLDEHLATKQDIERLRSMISGLVTGRHSAAAEPTRIQDRIWDLASRNRSEPRHRPPDRRRGQAPGFGLREPHDNHPGGRHQIRMLRIERPPIGREALAEAGRRPGAYALPPVMAFQANTGPLTGSLVSDSAEIPARGSLRRRFDE